MLEDIIKLSFQNDCMVDFEKYFVSIAFKKKLMVDFEKYFFSIAFKKKLKFKKIKV